MKEDNRPVKMIYLCGPIDAISKEESSAWRTIAYDKLATMGIVSAVPGLETIKLTCEQIVELDSTMINLCDTVLINLNFLNDTSKQRIGTGTLIEIGMSFARNKKLIAFSEQPISDKFLFLKGMCDVVVSTMDEALQIIKTINEGA